MRRSEKSEVTRYAKESMRLSWRRGSKVKTRYSKHRKLKPTRGPKELTAPHRGKDKNKGLKQPQGRDTGTATTRGGNNSGHARKKEPYEGRPTERAYSKTELPKKSLAEMSRQR